jgi:hypothetical protein
MSQVNDIVRDALGHLRVLDANGVVKPLDMRDAIRALNVMMRRIEANGLALGWSDVSEPTDELPLPPEAEEAIGYNLAVRLRAKYGCEIEPDVIQMASAGMEALRRDRLVEMPLTPDRGPMYPGRYNTLTDEFY